MINHAYNWIKANGLDTKFGVDIKAIMVKEDGRTYKGVDIRCCMLSAAEALGAYCEEHAPYNVYLCKGRNYQIFFEPLYKEA
jgi:hypothetical protein